MIEKPGRDYYDVDLNGDGIVNVLDLGIFGSLFYFSEP